MTADIARLLEEASEASERGAPAIDPVRALRCRQELTRQRRRHAAGLALVVFVLLVQAVPRPAFGADLPAVAAAQPAADAVDAR